MPSNWIGKNWINMLGNTRMPICMKSPNILIVRQPPFAMHSNRWGWRAKKDHHLQRTRPGQSNALFDTAGRIFRLPTCLFGWNRIWPLPVPSLCPQPERANSESADKRKKIPTLISSVRTSRKIRPAVSNNALLWPGLVLCKWWSFFARHPHLFECIATAAGVQSKCLAISCR